MTAAATTPAATTSTVALDGPLDIARSVEFLRRNGDDLMDRWNGDRLTRTLTVDGRRVALSMRPAGDLDAPELEVTVSADTASTVDPAALRAAVAGQFAPTPVSWSALLAADSRLAERDAGTPGVRPLGLTDPLYSLVRSITAQQINLKFANVIRARLAESYGVRREVDGTAVYALEPDALAGASVTALRAMQLSERKATYLIGAAEAAADGRFDRRVLDELDDVELVRYLTRMRGIGRWTAEWFGARILFRPLLVAGDVVLRKAVGRLYGRGVPSEAEVRELFDGRSEERVLILRERRRTLL